MRSRGYSCGQWRARNRSQTWGRSPEYGDVWETARIFTGVRDHHNLGGELLVCASSEGQPGRCGGKRLKTGEERSGSVELEGCTVTCRPESGRALLRLRPVEGEESKSNVGQEPRIRGRLGTVSARLLPPADSSSLADTEKE